MHVQMDKFSDAHAEAQNAVDAPGPRTQPLFRLLAFIREPLPPGAKHVRLCPGCRTLKLMMILMMMIVVAVVVVAEAKTTMMIIIIPKPFVINTGDTGTGESRHPACHCVIVHPLQPA